MAIQEVNELFSEEFDQSLDFLFEDGLSWYPWVGKNYANTGGGLLIVGESHYTCEQDEEQAHQGVERFMANRDYTREVVGQCPITRRWNNRLFDNIPKALVGPNNIEAEILWKELAFYNFVQRPMEYHYKERPSSEDFAQGWLVFLGVMKVLRPRTCVFIGVAASNSFNEVMSDLGIKHSKIKWSGRLNNIYLRSPVSIEYGGVSTRIVFIKHASSYFSWKNWHVYLQEEMPLHIAHLISISTSVTKASVDIENGVVPDGR